MNLAEKKPLLEINDPSDRLTHDEFTRFLRISGPQGEIPVPLAFANKLSYWQLLFLSALLGAVIGLIGSFMLGISIIVPAMWYPCQTEYDPTCGYMMHGHIYFIPLIGCAGLTIGLIRWLTNYRMDTAILFHEAISMEGHLAAGFTTWVTNTLSMVFGSALGPEMGLVGFATGLGDTLADYINIGGSDKKLLVLAGISGAVGALVPCPIVAPLIVFELAVPPKEYMESAVILTVAGITSWVVCQHLLPRVDTFTNSFILNQDWEYDDTQILLGFCFGIISAAMALLTMFVKCLCKAVFLHLRIAYQESNRLLAEVVPATAAGLFMGVLCMVCPMVIGPGIMWNRYVIKWGATEQVPLEFLLVTLIAKLFSMGASMTSGFRGGPFLSLLFLGIVCGVITHRLCPHLPIGLCVGCFAAGIPSGMTAWPFTWTFIVCNAFFFGLNQALPVFVAAMTAYLFSCGSGCLQAVSEFELFSISPHAAKELIASGIDALIPDHISTKTTTSTNNTATTAHSSYQSA